MSDGALAKQADVPINVAEEASKQLFSLFKVAKAWGDAKSSYPANNDGFIETILGDKLQVFDSPDKMERLGVNVAVQG